MTSTGSGHDLQSMHSHSSTDIHLGVPLQHVIAVYRLEDGKPYFSIELAHLDDDTGQAASMNLQFGDPRDADLWITCIRGAATKARLLDPSAIPQKSIEYVARILEQERDYDPRHFRIFKTVQRASNKSNGRASTDDLSKLTSTICYLVIGVHKVHLIPLRKPLNRISSTSLSEMGNQMTFGIVSLSSVNLKADDDAMELGFRSAVYPLVSFYIGFLTTAGFLFANSTRSI